MPRPPLPPPAWYADRRRASALRYWDGRRWTSRWRPAPGWTGLREPTPPPAPAPRPGARTMRRARRLALASAAALAAAATLGTVVSLGHREHVARISDAVFVRSANSACSAVIDPLRRERPPKRVGAGERAARIDRLASALAGLASQLRTIPIQDADRPATQAWLASWDDYTAIGHDLAASLRAADGRASSLASQANAVDLRVQLFSRVNGIDQCVF